MGVELLASVMNTTWERAARDMNLSSDAVIINQCDRYAYEEEEWKGKRIRFFSMAERGVGRSRTNAILRAEGDICLFADGDMVYEDDYESKIEAEFARHPKADMLLFQVEVEEARRTYENTGVKRVRWYNCGRYGAVSFAVRREKLVSSGVTFSLLFGGGAPYSNGEDSLFLKEFMKKGYRVYTSPLVIGRERAGESTWFRGYGEKFFRDRGVLYHYLYGMWALPLALRFLLAHRGKVCAENGVGRALGWMACGIREGRKLRKGRRQAR